jgi:hypothetical protein
MSLDRCPGCRARLAPDVASCHRCGCDLALVRQVEQHAQAALGRALRAWAGGDLPGALAQARMAQGLHGEPLVRAVVHCLEGIDAEAQLPEIPHQLAPSPASAGKGWGEGAVEADPPAFSSPPAYPRSTL